MGKKGDVQMHQKGKYRDPCKRALPEHLDSQRPCPAHIGSDVIVEGADGQAACWLVVHYLTKKVETVMEASQWQNGDGSKLKY